MENRISAELTDEAEAAVLAAFDTIEQHLPFLLSLTAEESRRLPRMGDRNTPFVQETLQVAHLAAEHLPRRFDLAEVDRDLALYRRFAPLCKRMESLGERMQDTCDVLSADLYLACLEAYRYLKAADRAEGLEALLDRVGRRFAGQGRRAAADPTRP